MTAVPLRDEQTALTRQRIVRAMADLLLTGHPASFSVPAVAERAGVSVRTVYRYFPTKELLLDALSELGGTASIELLDRTAEGKEFTVDDYVDAIPALWAGLYDNAAYMRAQAVNPILRETRSRRIADRRTRIETGLRSIDGLSDDDIDRMTSLIQVLASSWTMLDLVDEAGLAPAEAAALVQWAIRSLVDTAKREHHQGGGDADN